MKKTILRQRAYIPYVFVSPFILSFLLFYLYPLISTTIMSFQDIKPGQVRFVGLKNYYDLNHEHFFIAIRNSFMYTVLTIALLIPIPVIFATLLNSKVCIGSRIFRGVFFIPSLVSVVVAGTIIRLIFAQSPNAIVNSIMGFFGREPQIWLQSTQGHAMFLLVLIALWRWTGINIIYFMSGLQTIPVELYEAADIDGANALQKFRIITLPLLKPIIIFVTTISIFGGFSMFEESYVLWAGKSPNNFGLTMVGFIYRKGFWENNLGYGSAIGLVLLFIIAAVSLGQLFLWGFFKKEAD